MVVFTFSYHVKSKDRHRVAQLFGYGFSYSVLLFSSISVVESGISFSSSMPLEALTIFTSIRLYTKPIALKDANKPAGMNFLETKISR